MIRYLIASLLLPSALILQAEAYTPNFKGGSIPKGVSVSNANDLLPATSGYKRGWTADGWLVDRYGSRGYVALSPTYTESDQACDNRLTLPAVKIDGGEYLSWQAVSAHPDFLESYRVEVLPEGASQPTVLCEISGENARWTTRMYDLSAFSGQTVSVNFVCNSVNRYLLALDAISIDVPSEPAIEVRDLTPVFYGPQASAPVKIEAVNCGTALSGGRMLLFVAGKEVDRVDIEGIWKPGESREFELEAPLALDSTTGYTVSFAADGSDDILLLCNKTLYSSAFKRRPVVDKATGMWCVNCPEGILTTERLEEQMADGIIVLDTHCTSGSPQTDPLANDSYFNSLGFRGVPMMMLDRIAATASNQTAPFENYYYSPTEFGLNFSGLDLDGTDGATLSVEVRASKDCDNAGDIYRVGYVSYADVYQPDNIGFFQRNTSTQPAAERFFYLPAYIPSQLCVFHNVTFPSDYAFSGIEGSLPASITAENAAACRFSVNRPDEVADISDLHVAAFVLDTRSGQIIAADALRIGDADFAGIGSPYVAPTDANIAVLPGGEIRLDFASQTSYKLELINMAGSRVINFSGCASSASYTPNLQRGVYLLHLTAGGQTVIKKITF